MWKQHADDDRGHDRRGEDFDEHHGGGKVKPQASNLVFFGDSLTDNGNLFKLTQGTLPDTPWWKGRFSNGPTYAEQLPGLLGVSASHVQNYAYGGARAVTGNEAPIDLDIQVQAFVASLRGNAAPKGTEAVLYIGNWSCDQQDTDCDLDAAGQWRRKVRGVHAAALLDHACRSVRIDARWGRTRGGGRRDH
jgi:GDSL-like Lipase/Acylhydrolase